jgi:hypothetical protein
MEKNQRRQTDSHLDAPSESNTEKHINFRDVEEESSGNFAINKTTSDRQKQWQKEIKEGEDEKQLSDQTKDSSTMPMDEDDTLGVP